eukprot:TRINITY_DN2281_c0_g1_i1.p1 TRINITY_DN2281_c0_g1~~TRINITY_DN2281_c0_g1_i1.p1  ORF type:complete len:558 (+),score=179.84 TRINITY_DN2281_c0_g1_i1:55-1728(+)
MMFRTMLVASMAALVSADGIFKVNQWMFPFSDEDKCSTFSFNAGCDCDSVIKGGAVHIEENYIKDKDSFRCTICSKYKITTEFDAEKGIFYLKGEATIGTYSKILANVEFKTTSGSGDTRTLLMNYGHGLFSRKNHHFYEYTAMKDINWLDAQAACAAKSNDMFGLVGYLMTITSQEEQDIASSKLTGRGWFGASDAGTEGTWRWVTGPEGCPPYDTTRTDAARSACRMAPLERTFDGCRGDQCNEGTLIGYQKQNPHSFTNAPGAFSQWAVGEPNEYRQTCPGLCTTAGEDYGHFYADGNWNDYPIEHTMDGYMCEWGNVGDLCMPYNYVSRTIMLYDTCPPAAAVEVSEIPVQGLVKKLDGMPVTEGMLGWSYEETNVRLTAIPQVYMQPGALVFFPDQNDKAIPVGSSFRLTCPFNCDNSPCDFYVVMYHCPPCSRNSNGRLTGLLPSDGWVAGSCAPRFSFVNEHYQMVAFKKQIAAGETYDLPATEEDLVHFAIFGNYGALNCEEQNNQNDCLASSTCAWINDKCIDDWCPRIRNPSGGPPSCTECAPTTFQ